MKTRTALESENMMGVTNLYGNQPCRFYMCISIHSEFNWNHVCNGPAMIIFRVSVNSIFILPFIHPFSLSIHSFVHPSFLSINPSIHLLSSVDEMSEFPC